MFWILSWTSLWYPACRVSKSLVWQMQMMNCRPECSCRILTDRCQLWMITVAWCFVSLATSQWGIEEHCLWDSWTWCLLPCTGFFLICITNEGLTLVRSVTLSYFLSLLYSWYTQNAVVPLFSCSMYNQHCQSQALRY